MQLPEKRRKKRFISVINGKVEKVGEKRKGASHKLLFIRDRRERKPCEYKSLLSFVGNPTKKLLFSPTHLRIP